jgi:hypothetical protein
MTKVLIAATALTLIGLASAAQAHRRPPQAPSEEARLECPSVKNWAKCLWQELDRKSGG